ncbi:hypothetical protein ACT8ZR_05585 [Neobacillus sp. M.A.Huq-85]|nr:hypothetical protein QNK12_08035 [Neobacillus cucumis]
MVIWEVQVGQVQVIPVQVIAVQVSAMDVYADSSENYNQVLKWIYFYKVEQ